MDGIVVFLSGNYSYMYPQKVESGLVCFTEDDDKENFYVFSIGDQSLSIFKNQPNSGFPVWFSKKSTLDTPGVPWLSFVENDHHKNVKIVEVVDRAAEGINSNEPCDAVKLVIERKEEDHAFSKLPGNINWRVLQFLHSEMDYANLRATCRKLREVAPPICWKPHEISSVEFPWLMLFPDKDSPCSSFIDPSCNMRYFKSNQELLGCKILYSNAGWLLVSTRDMRTLFFFEPFSKTKITLPDFPQDFHIDGISFSSLPTSSDWVIVAIVSTMRRLRVAYLRSYDNTWVVSHIGMGVTSFISCGCSPVFHDSKFYSLGRDGNLVCVCLEVNSATARFITATTSIIDGSSTKLCLSNSCRGYPVSCDDQDKGGLYLVTVGLLGNFVNVYKLDVAASKWNEVKSVDQFSFFISQTSSFAISVRPLKVSGMEDQAGLVRARPIDTSPNRALTDQLYNLMCLKLVMTMLELNKFKSKHVNNGTLLTLLRLF